MKKIYFFLAALCFTVSACMFSATPQPQVAGPAPLSETDIQATVAFQVEQTLQSLPTPSLAPSNTPVVITVTSAPTQAVPTPTSTETQNPSLLTLTATLGTGTVVVGTAGTLPFTATPSSTPNPAFSVTPTGNKPLSVLWYNAAQFAFRAHFVAQQVKNRGLYFIAMHHPGWVCDDH